MTEIVPSLISGLSFPKTMRWDKVGFHFARPIRWLVSLLDEEILPLQIAGLVADKITRGHRILGEQNIVLRHPRDYEELLRENYVLVDQDVRQKECWQQICQVAHQQQGEVKENDVLLTEITNLLEWPQALGGSFSEEYLELPPEVIITPMREQQRYFPVHDSAGNLLNYFITVRNGGAAHLETVRIGNERVLKARLADARFFWQEDLKIKLADYLPRLARVIFQENLGTVAAKTKRLEVIVGQLAKKLCLKQTVLNHLLRAAKLAKADLVTNMVGEFPELQGVMGYYYALRSGEEREVAQAIREHYQPRFSGDFTPPSLAGALLSLADKIDTLVGCFAIGIEPTGSQDPYALRRQALGICLILLDHRLEIGLDELIRLAVVNYHDHLSAAQLGEETVAQVKEFLRMRLKNILGEKGYRYDISEAVLATEGGDFSPLMAVQRAEALSSMRDKEDFRRLLTAFTRAYNLTKTRNVGEIKPEYFQEESEKKLAQALEKAEEGLHPLWLSRDFAGIMVVLSQLSNYIDDFFVAVMVMCDNQEIRENRLALLARFVSLTCYLGDLSKIVNTMV